ncbi:MAG: sugar ABC transporter ATP-binding protein [Nocardiopsaceae bacterium]|nr:sugar ABC transporter ATP-binding protein [Nocardiopsaceae bacterium]
MEPRLEMRDITKSFGDVAVLRGVSLELAPGEIHGLVGQNGAGKSTLTRILAGGHADYGGTVRIDGSPVRLGSPRDAARHGIAVIYQDFSLVPQLSAADNIMLGSEPGRVTFRAKSIRQAAARLLDTAGMADTIPLDAEVRTLSAAVRQRVEIAKALTRNARVLVLDEPTARLADADRERLFALMRQVAARGTALIFISHFLGEVLDVTSRLTVLRDGAFTASGQAADFGTTSLTTAMLGRELAAVEEEEASDKIRGRAAVLPGGHPRTPDATARTAPGTPALLAATGLAGGRQVRDVSLAVHGGEVVGLAGLVGSGRSTLARMLVGATPLREGSLRIRGKAVRLRSPRAALRAGLALVPEDRRAQGLVTTSPASENVVLMALAGTGRAGIVGPRSLRKIAREAIATYEVRPPDADLGGGAFSGGNQQKLVLARAILANPDVLVADQPTAGVDVGTKAQIHTIIRDLAGAGKGVLLISDDLDELLALSDRLLVMRSGTVVSEVAGTAATRDQLVGAMSAGTPSTGTR